MEDIINALILIEDNAGALIDEALEEQKNIEQKILEKQEAVRDEINKRTDRKLERLYADAQRKSSAKSAEIKRKSDKWLNILTDEFERNKNDWETNIFDRIIKP
ncbi:MAG: hypothetical protein LBQ68_06515 [Clostridiales bacterium]|nr:hypothetical protein [Clostridiales bacterium]